MAPITLVLADDHPLVLEGLEKILHAEKDLNVVARCLDGDETLRAVRRYKPDLLVLDLAMPKLDGMAVVRAMRHEGLDTKIIVLTGYLDDDEYVKLVGYGVRGVLLKEMAPRLAVRCIRKVHAGGMWIEQETAGRVLQRLGGGGGDLGGDPENDGGLTDREQEVLRLARQGAQNKEIAEALRISENTVKIHIHNIYEKLGVKNRTELVLRHRRGRAASRPAGEVDVRPPTK